MMHRHCGTKQSTTVDIHASTPNKRRDQVSRSSQHPGNLSEPGMPETQLKQIHMYIIHYFSSRHILWSDIRCLDFIIPEQIARGIFNADNVYQTTFLELK